MCSAQWFGSPPIGAVYRPAPSMTCIPATLRTRVLPAGVDVGTPALDGNDESLVAQEGDGLARGATGDAELLLQLRLAGHRPVRQQLPGLDARPQDVGNLDVDGRGTVGIDGLPRCHARQLTRACSWRTVLIRVWTGVDGHRQVV